MNMDVDVTVNAYKPGPGSFQFDMDFNGQRTDKLKFDKKDHNLKKEDRYDVHFRLENHKGAKLRFVQDEAIVMWTRKGGGKACPKGNEYQGNEFKVTDIDDKKLTVQNRDETRSLYKFLLHFVDEETGALVRYDPIWDNRNNGR